MKFLEYAPFANFGFFFVEDIAVTNLCHNKSNLPCSSCLPMNANLYRWCKNETRICGEVVRVCRPIFTRREEEIFRSNAIIPVSNIAV